MRSGENVIQLRSPETGVKDSWDALGSLYYVCHANIWASKINAIFGAGIISTSKLGPLAHKPDFFHQFQHPDGVRKAPTCIQIGEKIVNF
jgi:hypothetical protein